MVGNATLLNAWTPLFDAQGLLQELAKPSSLHRLLRLLHRWSVVWMPLSHSDTHHWVTTLCLLESSHNIASLHIKFPKVLTQQIQHPCLVKLPLWCNTSSRMKKGVAWLRMHTQFCAYSTTPDQTHIYKLMDGPCAPTMQVEAITLI